MRRRVVVCFTIGIIMILIGLGYHLNRFHLLTDLYAKGKFSNNPKIDSTLRVGLIGDSWVQYGGLDSIIHNRLDEAKINNEIIYSGEGGKTTKGVYENMYRPDSTYFSSKKVIDSHPKYCVVISGVNDSNGQFGKEYYSHHLFLIIETLIKENIQPIIISIPHYGIEERFNMSGKFMRLRYKTFALMNNGGEINNIQSYNNRFIEDLNQSPYKDSIIYIDVNNVLEKYSENSSLHYDQLHLNLKGRQRLGKIIADSIRKIESKL